MHTVQNIKKVSLLFFLVLVGGHITASLLVAKGYENKTLELIHQTLDLPALLAAVLYGFTSIKVYMEEIGKDTKGFDTLSGVFGALLLIGAIYLNFFYIP